MRLSGRLRSPRAGIITRPEVAIGLALPSRDGRTPSHGSAEQHTLACRSGLRVRAARNADSRNAAAKSLRMIGGRWSRPRRSSERGWRTMRVVNRVTSSLSTMTRGTHAGPRPRSRPTSPCSGRCSFDLVTRSEGLPPRVASAQSEGVADDRVTPTRVNNRGLVAGKPPRQGRDPAHAVPVRLPLRVSRAR